MAEIFGYPIMGGGGNGSGGTLTVTGVAGSTVTASKDGKTRTRTLDSTGKAIFKGLASGTWTLTMTNGTQTATRTVTVSADYAVTIAYFSATVNITYPAGSTCTATNGATTLTAPDTTGTWACIVPNAGTWTVSCTDGSKTKTDTVTITTDGEIKSLTLNYAIWLLKDGDQCTAATGGWQAAALKEDNYSIPTKPTVSYSGGKVTLSIGSNDNGDPCGGLVTSNKIDLTNIKTIIFSGAIAESPKQVYKVFVNTTGSAQNTKASVTITSSNASLAKLDVSSLSGTYYVFLLVKYDAAASGTGTAKLVCNTLDAS